MANQLDLEEQEQLDQLKHFWQQYGNLITWGLIVILAAIAGWNGYQTWQRKQSLQAAAMFDEVEHTVQVGDVAKAQRAFTDMQERFAKAVYTQQAGLMLAKMAYDAGNVSAAKTALTWVAEHATDQGYATVARLRLSGILLDAKAYDEAQQLLAADTNPAFAALVADRRGDIYVLQGKKAEAKAEYQKAYGLFDGKTAYRRMVGVKLGALGVDPASLDRPPAAEGDK